MLDVGLFFSQKSSESTTSIANVGKKLDEIFASLNAAKIQYNNMDTVEVKEEPDSGVDEDFFIKMEKRLNSFHETLSNATK